MTGTPHTMLFQTLLGDMSESSEPSFTQNKLNRFLKSIIFIKKSTAKILTSSFNDYNFEFFLFFSPKNSSLSGAGMESIEVQIQEPHNKHKNMPLKARRLAETQAQMGSAHTPEHLGDLTQSWESFQFSEEENRILNKKASQQQIEAPWKEEEEEAGSQFIIKIHKEAPHSTGILAPLALKRLKTSTLP